MVNHSDADVDSGVLARDSV